MEQIDTAFLARFFQAAAARLEAERDALCSLDGAIGDGDHGISMANGFAAVAALVRRWQPSQEQPSQDDPAKLMRAAAAAFLGEVGATVGPLYATGMLDAADLFDARGPVPLEQAHLFLAALASGIARRGQAEPGDKTMLDAWLPAVQTAQTAADAGYPPAEALWSAVDAARKGATATATMIASRGRAKRLQARSLGHRDPGAVSATLILEALAQTAGTAPARPD